MVQIVPSILSADFSRLAEEIARVEGAGITMLHVDVMDGHFVPNLTLGPPLVESIRKRSRLKFDCHLMVEDPDFIAPLFIKAGANLVSVHAEVARNLDRTLHAIQDEGALAGVVINPATPIEMIENVLDFVDYVLVMSVNPGFGGQSFIPRSLDKVRRLDGIREQHRYRYKIEIDGGVSHSNVAEIVRAGCDWLVAGSAVFHSEDAAAAVKDMQQIAAEANTIKV
jgi:ribulose-phosphate 3-epimerase